MISTVLKTNDDGLSSLADILKNENKSEAITIISKGENIRQ